MTAHLSLRWAPVTVLGAALLAACATGAYRRADTRPGVQVITAEQIARSGASTAWDVLKREAPTLTLRDTRGGRPGSAGRRGRSSIVLQDAPLVVLDGVRLTDFRALDGIPAATILTISIYNGIEGTTFYGTNAVSGVIVIKTKDGADQE
ncbi:MAG TPA: Plug domain-containing protein [Gemmatimonadales bacterium]|nr:Plug domain-containing protein [Gemmatimonadales bacterium]